MKPRSAVGMAAETRTGWKFLFPAILLIALITILPALYALGMSFFSWNGLSAKWTFVGLENYRKLFHDRTLAQAISNTALFTLINVVFKPAAALALAYAIESVTLTWLRITYRTIFFSTSLISAAIAAMIWAFVYDPNIGFLNQILGTQILWLGDRHLVLWSIAAVGIWQFLGQNALILAAGLQSVPRELYDAAEMDGATVWGKFRFVALPHLRSFIAIVVVINIINNLKAYDLFKVMTDGGPRHASEVIATHIVKVAFEKGELGYAAAISYALLLVTLILVVVYLYLTEFRREERT
ncbi:carbohydrate ABC transporter permease [Martelella soudanensis]|uniref:carbohydrate ABC transporter permease n=1 Tax=unclassified Martelella TaxID=2629616 RepID=UPI0015DE32AE|nr:MULTISPECIES: sugar ABC transporter permease [unclassified Martelella]